MTASDVRLDHAPPDPPRRPSRVWLVAAAVVVAVLVAVSFHQVRKPTAQLGDFGAYYRAGQAVAAGRSPYTLDPAFGALGAYMYCPAFAHWACRPLARLRYVPAMRTFLAINWLATAAVVALSVRLAGRAGFWAGLVATAAVGPYLWADLHNGQVGTLLLLACLGWIVPTLAGRPVLGGLSLSLAVGLKLYPLLLAPYLLLRRRWWPGLIGLAAGLAIQFVAPAPFFGVGSLVPLHVEWLRFCLQTQLPMQTYRAGNQSLLGVLARTSPVSNGERLYSAARLDGLQHAYPAVVAIVTVALYGWLFARRTRHPAADVAVLLVWMTVASPRAWTFNFAAELPAAVLLAAAIVRRRPGWPLAVVALLAVVYAVAFPTNALPPQGAAWSAVVQFLFDKHFTAAVVVAVAVASTVRPTPAASAAAGLPVASRT